ncbi:MAG: hypothetical protein AB1746_12730 [Candidatus Zixiibacteriota bacterium]
MGAFLSISLWVALATVIPGLVTITVLHGAYLIVNPNFLCPYVNLLAVESDLLWTAMAITAMVLTQAFGIIFENVAIDKKWYGHKDGIKCEIEKGIDPHGETNIMIDPYAEYKGIYILLSELDENEDSQGHLKRCLAQFFLTNNTIISFLAALVATVILFACAPTKLTLIKATAYFFLILFFLIVTFKVARIRFAVMAKALWAARRKRLPKEQSRGILFE